MAATATHPSPHRPAAVLDLRLIPAAAAAWLTAAGATRMVAWQAITLGLLAWVLAVAVLARRRGNAWALAVLCLLSIGLVAGPCGLRASVRGDDELVRAAAARTTLTVTGVVTGEPTVIRTAGRPPVSIITLDLRNWKRFWDSDVRAVGGQAEVTLNGADLQLPVGGLVSVHGRSRPTDPGSRASVELTAEQPPVVIEAPNRLQHTATQVRHGLRDAASGLPEDAAGLLPALVFGDTSGLPTLLRTDMRTSGLSHLSAVSGANVTLWCGAVLLMVRLPRWRGRRIGWGGQTLAAGLALAGFVVVTGPQPSVLRAAVMGAVGLLGLLLGRSRQAVPALAAAVLVLLAADPYLAGDLGFVLSVVATAGIVLLGPLVARPLRLILPRPLALAVAVPVAAQLVCTPILLVIQPALPTYSVVANLLADPAVGPATVLGALAACCGWAPGLAAALAWLAGWPVQWIALVAHTTASWPGALIPWPGGLFGQAVAALISVALAVLAWWVGQSMPEREVRAPGKPVLAAAASLLLVIGSVAWWVGRSDWPAPDWAVVFCDVGQGDAAVINSGNGAAVVVDAGPDPAKVLDCLDRLGIRTVNLFVLSHFHLDHTAGLPGVLQGRTLQATALAPFAQPVANARELQRQLTTAQVADTPALAGATGAAGPFRLDVVWPRVVNPVTTAARNSDDDPLAHQINNDSLCLLLRAPGLSVLFTGDLEPEGQAGLLNHLREIGVSGVDVVKVAHHGSRYQDPELYRALHPRLAVISVGADNDYGHPASSTLAMLQGSVGQVVRTDQSGDIAIGIGESGPWVRTRGHSLW